MKLASVLVVSVAVQVVNLSIASAHGTHYRHLEFAHHRYSSESVGGRPSAWCGWEMRRLVGNDPGPEFNLARNWARWGRPAGGPAPGAIGVMPHHVFKVVQVLDHRTVLAISGNDGHAVRVRPRSTAGVIAWRM
jgi:hypothetical protein